MKEYVDVAAVLGAPRMRHDITQGYKGDRAKSYERPGPQPGPGGAGGRPVRRRRRAC